ncbi:MAG: EAL domain-containing response regulator [Rhizobiaceae bacterium]
MNSAENSEQTLNPQYAPTVMVIDDDPVFRALMEHILVSRGAGRVVLASDGAKAHQLLAEETHSIDFITLDLSMPNQDGVGFLRLASELGFKGRLLLISGEHQSVRNSAGKLAAMLKLDCAGVLAKPADYNQVAQIVLSPRDSRQKPRERVHVDADEINSALRNSRLFAYYQPRIDIATGRIAGAEALARMRNQEGQLLDAGQMINLAEENGRIADITWRMIEIVAEEAAILVNEHDETFKISFNVSGSILSNPQFPQQFVDIIRLSGMRPENFILELTETRLPQDTPQSLELMTRLRMQGFGLAIDDFGTGYSNIEQLRLFPFTELKIDRSFMSGALNDKFALACAEASVSLARELDLLVVGEGIETVDELEMARSIGVDEAQGYLFSKPLPFQEFCDYVRSATVQAPMLGNVALRQAG